MFTHCDDQGEPYVLTADSSSAALEDLIPFVYFWSPDGEKLKQANLHFSHLDLFKGKYLLMK